MTAWTLNQLNQSARHFGGGPICWSLTGTTRNAAGPV